MKMGYLSVCALVLLLLTACSNQSASQSVKQDTQSEVVVSGTGSVSVKPDTLTMSVSMSHTAKTTRLAREAVGKMTKQVLDILQEANIEDKNIGTTSLTFYPEYNWVKDRQVLIGQRADQQIVFSIDDIQNDSEKASAVIDELTQINGIRLNNMDFNVKNNTEHYVKSRELAYQKAVQKAEQYAKLSNMKVVKAMSIKEDGLPQIYPVGSGNAMRESMDMKYDAGSTVLPSGELEITTNISVTFLLQ